ncbi:hypothetical protein Ahy_B03g068522 isoform E [Arachis hypogaea]|uniref:Uncharacterized protein n=1 Tax=Arachis hypogaea TaxID=3818 RepID=A0A445AA46_ARAHY|nr:hypothetical protein Ahy_B03g068522 isoform E [Arachis hypogaea]
MSLSATLDYPSSLALTKFVVGIRFLGIGFQLKWGINDILKMPKKAFPPLEFPELGSCNLLQSFLNNELGISSRERLLCLVSCYVVTSFKHSSKIVTHLFLFVRSVLYSSNEELRNSSSVNTCLLCFLLVDQLPVKIGWFPEYSDLRRALDTSGFLFEFSSSGEPKNLDSDTGEPPQNIRAWLKFVTACCLMRSKQPAFSVVEAEELIESIIRLFLDRQFQGLLVLLNDCMQAIVNYFTDQEWHSSCENIAKFVASRVAQLESLGVVEALKDQGVCRWNYVLINVQQHVKSHVRLFSQFPSSSSAMGSITVLKRSQKAKQSEESLREVMYLSCWGPM